MSRNIDNVVQQMIVVQDTSTNALKLLAPIPTIATKIDVMLELFHGLLKSSRESAVRLWVVPTFNMLIK